MVCLGLLSGQQKKVIVFSWLDTIGSHEAEWLQLCDIHLRLFCLLVQLVEECRNLNREPGFKSPLLLFRSMGIFVISTMHQFTQLYNK